jgi:hypothetical protein
MKPQPSTVLAPTQGELVEFLLAETDQRSAEPVEVRSLLDLLKLRSLHVDFDSELPEARTAAGEPVRALLDYRERLVAVHSALNCRRSRFSSLHEIGHYVLPSHTGQIVVCGESDVSIRAARAQEREANAFAAELQFKGRLFKLVTAVLPISAATVMHIAETFDASFESSARHLVESSLRPCLFAAYTRKDALDSAMPSTSVRYSIPSSSFKEAFGSQLSDDDNEHVLEVWATGRDIADSITDEVMIETANGETTRFHAEYFFNGYNAFCLLSA